MVPIPSLTSHEAFDSGVVLGWCLARLRQPGWSITAGRRARRPAGSAQSVTVVMLVPRSETKLQ